jgi:hypothetical protein
MGDGSKQANTRCEQCAAAGGRDTGSANPEQTLPDIAVKISGTRWEGQKAVVEGT